MAQKIWCSIQQCRARGAQLNLSCRGLTIVIILSLAYPVHLIRYGNKCLLQFSFRSLLLILSYFPFPSSTSSSSSLFFLLHHHRHHHHHHRHHHHHHHHHHRHCRRHHHHHHHHHQYVIVVIVIILLLTCDLLVFCYYYSFKFSAYTLWINFSSDFEFI